MNSLTVCVEYDDLLALTLAANARHFQRTLVITSAADHRTQRLVASFPGVSLHVTDAFYRHGAAFNKGLAVEEGFDVLGRQGWLVVWDADTVMPKEMDLSDIAPGYLYTPRRRMCRKPERYEASAPWTRWPLIHEKEWAGYFHLFHASDPVLRTRPWYGTNWKHAGGCDTVFQAKWPAKRKRHCAFEVLHLGPMMQNWFGRATRRLDGTVPKDAAQRATEQTQMLKDRRRYGFAREKVQMWTYLP